MAHTLVYSSRWYRGNILSYSDESPDTACNKLIDKLFQKKTNRVEFRNGRYFYHYSEDYKKFLVRIKKIR